MVMFSGSIPGLDKIFIKETDIRRTVLIAGESGCMKSTFTYSLLSNLLEKTGEKALYLTLEEGKDSLMANLKSVGATISPNIKIIDYRVIRAQFKSEKQNLDYIYMIDTLISSYKRQVGDSFKFIILDSLGALYSLLAVKDPRSDVYIFFNLLDEKGLNSFVISERSLLDSSMGTETYLSDGVIELGYLETQRSVKRYIQVKKMRACHHRMEKFSIEVKEDGIHVMGPMYGY